MVPSGARTTRVISRLGWDSRQTAQVRVGTWSGLRFGIGGGLLLGRRRVRVLTAGGGGRPARLGADVDAPAGQLGGQAGVLALLADGQAELPLRDDDVRDLVLLVDADAEHLGGAERLGHEAAGILVPQDDVHLLAVELGHDRLDSRAALPDGGALGVDALLPALDGDLRTAAGLAGDAADDDRPVVDLGDLHLHQATEEAPMRTAGHDHGAARGAAHLHDV